MKAEQRKKTVSLETNSIAVLSCTVLWLMQVSWSFHGVSMQVSCWLHAGFADLAYWCVTSMTTPSNLHGICMEPPWNLHQAECMVKPTSVDRGITSITHMETAWNLHQFSMEPAWNLHESASVRRRHATITFRHKKQRNLNGASMKPTSILHGTCMDTPSKKRHTSTRCRYREQRLFF